MKNAAEFVLGRAFDARIDLVRRAWTDPKLLARWYGAGVETVIHKHELTPGGEWHNEMKWGEKSDYSKMVFQETALNKLTWNHTPTDKSWNAIASSMMPDWPSVVLNTVTFEEEGDITNVRLTMIPVDASEVEIACFKQARAGISSCFSSGYAIVDELLAGLQA